MEDIILEKQKEGKVITMCTVVERFMEEGREEGREEERERLVINFYKKRKTQEEIAELMDISLEEVKKIIEHCEEKK